MHYQLRNQFQILLADLRATPIHLLTTPRKGCQRAQERQRQQQEAADQENEAAAAAEARALSARAVPPKPPRRGSVYQRNREAIRTSMAAKDSPSQRDAPSPIPDLPSSPQAGDALDAATTADVATAAAAAAAMEAAVDTAVVAGGRQSHRAGWPEKKMNVLGVSAVFRRFEVDLTFVDFSFAFWDVFGTLLDNCYWF